MRNRFLMTLPIGRKRPDRQYFIGEASLAIWLARAPLFVSVLAAFVLNVPQTVEIYYLFGENGLAKSFVQILLSIAFLIVFCLLLWRVSHDLLAIGQYHQRSTTKRARAFRRILPAIIAAIPLFGLTSGIFDSYRDLAIIRTDALPVSSAKTSLGAEAETATETTDASVGGKANSSEIAEASKLAIKPHDYGALSREHQRILADLKTSMEALQQPERVLRIAGYLVLGLAVILVGIGVLHAWQGPASLFAERDDDSIVPRCLRWKAVWIGAFILLITAFTLQGNSWLGRQGIEMTAFPRLFGTISIVMAFLIFLTIFLSLLSRVYDKRGIPVITIMLAIAVFASYRDWNNNHDIRPLKREKSPFGPPPLSVAFIEWVRGRPGGISESGYVKNYLKTKKTFPVYVFAMQGGGQYSSTFASLTLAKLFDRCPALRHHVFVIGAVSGGAVGSGVFVSHLKALLDQGDAHFTSNRCDFNLADSVTVKSESGQMLGPLEAKIQAFQHQDFLAPLAAQALFGDTLQRFVPYPFHFLDRARAFEVGLEATWRRVNPGVKSPLEGDFLDHWTSTGGVPMLMLATTRVQTGEPIVVAPFMTRRAEVNSGEVRSIFNQPLKVGHSLRFSTALGLSARFPIVMPIGRVHAEGDKSYFDLVDGGYFENSAADSIGALLNELESYKNFPQIFDPGNTLTGVLDKIKFEVVVLNEVVSKDDKSYDRETLNEVASPIDALYRARQQRGAMAINRLQSQFSTRVIRISHSPWPLPLGWRLSYSKQEFISAMAGEPSACNNARPGDIKRATRLVATRYAEAFKTTAKLTGDNRKRVGDNIGSLFYLMHFNRCILKDIIKDIKLEDAAPITDAGKR